MVLTIVILITIRGSWFSGDIQLNVGPCIDLFVYLSVCPSVSLSLHPYIHMTYENLYMHPSVHKSIYLSIIHLSMVNSALQWWTSIHPSIHLSICLFICLSKSRPATNNNSCSAKPCLWLGLTWWWVTETLAPSSLCFPSSLSSSTLSLGNYKLSHTTPYLTLIDNYSIN